MKIGHYLHLLFSLPPAGIWHRVKKRVWQTTRRMQISITGASLAKLNYRQDVISDIPDKYALLEHIRQGPYAAFFIDDQKKDQTAQQFRELCPGEDKLIIRAADQVCAHVFDLLGSGPCALGDEVDWQLDFKSGHRWDAETFYLDLHPASYPGGYDIKVPWELSRCQHFLWLGQAYWLTGDETYAREFRAQVEHWLPNNLPQMGVNWVCTMDVSIRAVNWLWGYAYFRHSTSLPDTFHILFYRAMLEHGRHILHNLEYSEFLTSNHYLSNVVGLVYLGILLPELKEAKTWRELGLRELEIEMARQVYADGVDFEASTNYHRLVTELFLSATMLAQINGICFSPEYLTRLERMINVIGLVMRPDGTIPVVGDQDNGRLHRLKVWKDPQSEWNDFRPLVAAGSVWLNKPAAMKFASSDLTEAFWLAGPQAIRQFQQLQHRFNPEQTGSVWLQHGGWAILRSQDHYLMIEASAVGQNEQGGHAHNDSLSIEIFANEQAWIIDPGTFVYTADYEARHAFRLTQAHNTVTITGYEQNQIDSKRPFQTITPSRTSVIHWETNQNFSMIIAEVQYACSPIITHRRAVMYTTKARAWLIADSVFPEGPDARIHLCFPSDVKVTEIEHPFPGVQLSSDNGNSAWVYSLHEEKPQISRCWVSRSYGTKQESLQAEFGLSRDPVHFWVFLPEQQNGDIEKRIQTLINTWEGSPGASYLENRDQNV